MYMIVTLEVVYDHVGKCRELALLFYTNYSDSILPDHHQEMKFQAKSHVIET